MQRLIYVPPDGDTWGADVVIVGEAPGAEEEKGGRPFIGRSGKLLRSVLTEAGLEWSRVLITNVVCVRPEDNRTPSQEELESWLPHLEDQVANRNAILAVGKTAQAAVGRLGIQYTGVYHSAYILRNGVHREHWEAELRDWVSGLPQRHSVSLPVPGNEGSTEAGTTGD